MTGITTVRLVAAREIKQRLRGRAIWVATAFTALVIVGLIVIPTLVQSHATATTVGLVGAPAQATRSTIEYFAAQQQTSVAIEDIPSGAAAQADVENGTIDVALTITARGAVAQVETSLDPGVASVLQDALNVAHLRGVLSAAGVRPATINSALQPVSLATAALQPPPPQPPDSGARIGAAFTAAVLLYISFQIYGGVIANAVAQEKTSRTAEVLLSAMRPFQLLTGKVLGVGVVGLVQIATAVVAGLIANAVVMSAIIPADVWLLLPAVVLWFVLGYLLYALAYAAAGAMVSRQEEVNVVSVPITMFILVGYLLTYAAVGVPHALWLSIVSYIPPFAPILMPVRIALGVVAPWETPVAVLIMLASIYGAARISARIYAGTLVRSGARLGWRAALRIRRTDPAAVPGGG